MIKGRGGQGGADCWWCSWTRRTRVATVCLAVAMNAEQVEGLSYSQPLLLLHCTLFTKRGYRHGDRPRFVDFD